MNILVVDNYDSFVYNLVQYIGQLGFECTIWRNDDERLADPAVLEQFDAVLISPGPGEPGDAGYSIQIIRECERRKLSMLGVCLGHQGLAEALGGRVVRAGELLHGKTSEVKHTGEGVLAGIPNPFTVTRYHSLTVEEETLPECLKATAWSDSGMIMAMRHVSLPMHGVQFHPESIMTSYGHRILGNWLAEAGFPVDFNRVEELEAAHQRVLRGL